MKYKNKYWTSEFKIVTDVDFNIEHIERVLNSLETIYSKFNPNSDLNLGKVVSNEFILKKTNLTESDFNKFINYSAGTDYTGIMKGLALYMIAKYLLDDVVGSKSFHLNFGGDIVNYNYETVVKIEDSNFNLALGQGFTCVFTSGNTDKRGKHILVKGGLNYGDTATVVIHGFDPVLADFLATSLVSNYFFDYSEYEKIFKIEVYNSINRKVKVGSENKSVYIASPFFNKKEIRIRDKMIMNCMNYFRPDMTESSREWDSSEHTKELSLKIYEDNIKHIESSDCLYFPRYTDDLGTLYEVGVAIKLGKDIYRYDYKVDEIDKIDYRSYDAIEVFNDVINCSIKSGAILAGYNYKNPFKYYIGKLNDNIMLSSLHDRYDFVDNKLIKIEHDMKEMK